MMNILQEPLKNLFTSSQLLVLDFKDIPKNTPADESMEAYFRECEAKGINPRAPQNRQQFNNRLLAKTGKRYLVSRYSEDRSSMLTGSEIAKQGRTLHLGIDIFSRDLEPVHAPCDGQIVRVGNEPEDHSYGYYIVFQAKDSSLPYIFLGHLSADIHPAGPVKSGELIARLGDFNNGENGGWSRHLHVQMLTKLPPEGQAPIGYSSRANLEENKTRFPDPMQYFPEWNSKLLGLALSA